MNPLDLTNKQPKETFHRLVQHESGKYYDGLGNEITLTGITYIYDQTTTVNVNYTGSPTNVYANAGEVINGGKACYLSGGLVYVYKSTEAQHMGKFVGMALTSANEGEPLTLITDGLFINNGYGFIGGDIYYVSATGYPTNVVPTSPTDAFLYKLGVGIDSHTLLINNDLEFEL